MILQITGGWLLTIQIICSLLLVIFYGAYFYKIIILKRQGIKADRLGCKKGKKRRTIRLEIIVKITTYLMAVIQFLSIFLSYEWYFFEFSLPIMIIGIILLIVSDVIFILALMAMKNNWRAGISPLEETTLVTTGIYRISRNPAFLAFDLSYWGLILVFGNPINLFFTIILFILFDLQIGEEEKYLLEKFGEPYKIYKKNVRRYF